MLRIADNINAMNPVVAQALASLSRGAVDVPAAVLGIV